MVEALKTQERDAASRELSFLERLGMLVDQQWNWRKNQALGRRLKNAKLRTNACVEDIDYRGVLQFYSKSCVEVYAKGAIGKSLYTSSVRFSRITAIPSNIVW